MRLPFGLSAYSRAEGRLAPVRLINLFVEQSPTSPGGVVAMARPGLVVHAERSCRGLYREDGVFDGDLFEVSGADLIRAGEVIGALEGADRVEWAYTVDGLFILSGGTAYVYDGADLTETDFPDGAQVASICQMDNIVVAVRSDTGTMYFRLPGDTTWNALDFFSAERRPDFVLAVRILGDTLYAFGSATVEQFAPTGDAAVPFTRIGGASINRGLKDRDCLCQMDNTLFFVGEDNIVYRMTDGSPARVSDHGIEERVRRSSSAKAFSYTWEGHTFLVLGLDDETLAYDVAGGWSQYVVGPAPFPTLGLYDGVTTFVGGARVWTMEPVFTDDDAPMERLFTAILPIEAPVSVDALEVQLSPGVALADSEPALVQMRWSDDQGRTWTDWRTASTGFAGEYRRRVRYRRLGMADQPGRAFEIRTTDDVEMRFSGCEANPAGGGRSR